MAGRSGRFLQGFFDAEEGTPEPRVQRAAEEFVGDAGAGGRRELEPHAQEGREALVRRGKDRVVVLGRGLGESLASAMLIRQVRSAGCHRSSCRKQPQKSTAASAASSA